MIANHSIIASTLVLSEALECEVAYDEMSGNVTIDY